MCEPEREYPEYMNVLARLAVQTIARRKAEDNYDERRCRMTLPAVCRRTSTPALNDTE
jgi:hypothetical protein